MGNGIPEVETLMLLAEFFHVTVDQILKPVDDLEEHSELLYIMDASGSMSRLTEDVIGGFNSFIQDQKSLKDKAFLTTVLFNHKVTPLYQSKDIFYVEEINRDMYSANGSTALYDAIGLSVIKLSDRVHTNKVLVTIMTDGYENASRIFTESKVKALVKEKSALGWEFVFVGANIDVDRVSDGIGIRKDRRVRFESTSEGTRNVYSQMSDISSSYRTTGTFKTDKKRGESK